MMREAKPKKPYAVCFIRRFPRRLLEKYAAYCKLRAKPQYEVLADLLRARVKDARPFVPLANGRPVPSQNFYVKDMPRHLMQHFAAWCKLHGVYQKDVIARLVHDLVKEA